MTVWFGAVQSRPLVGVARRVLFTAMALLFAGCSKPPPPPPPPPPPTVISLQVSATGDANANADGQGAPVAIRVYQLDARSSFEGAEFFPLYHSDGATLGTDLIKRDEFLLIPNTNKTITLMPDPAVHNVGVFAAYADFQHATWRATAEIPAHQTTKITVTAEHAGLKLTAKSEKPPPPPEKPASDKPGS